MLIIEVNFYYKFDDEILVGNIIKVINRFIWY